MAIKPIFQKLAVVGVLGMLIVADAAPAKDSRDRESIEAFLDQYFLTWSNGDSDGYKNCFHPKASIVSLDRVNALHATLTLDAFIRTQMEAHRKSPVKMREIPLDKRVLIAGKVGQAMVRWKLFKGSRTVTGIDLFTLVLKSGKWQILHLVVQND